MEIIKVHLKEYSYNIYLDYGITKKIPVYLNQLSLGNLGIVIVPCSVYSIYKNIIKSIFKSNYYKIIPVIDGEKAKSKEWLFKVIREIVKFDEWNKKIFIICLGGGTIGDLGGFVASIYKRGIPYIQIPTTLLSQIDASIGGKTAIDSKEAKNILGTFYQPAAVFIDPFFLNTLPLREIKNGIAEAIKYGIIRKRELFYFLKNNPTKITSLNQSYMDKLISTCVKIKAKIVERDEKEKKGMRTILNFGHTFAHALEASLKYTRFSHGESVSIGMFYVAVLSYILGKCEIRDVWRIRETLQTFSLLLSIKANLDYRTLWKAMSYDKKFISGKVRMVLLKEIGKVEVVDNIPPKIVRKTLEFLASLN
jgi:3-dehydroquinate synthase